MEYLPFIERWFVIMKNKHKAGELSPRQTTFVKSKNGLVIKKKERAEKPKVVEPQLPRITPATNPVVKCSNDYDKIIESAAAPWQEFPPGYLFYCSGKT